MVGISPHILHLLATIFQSNLKGVNISWLKIEPVNRFAEKLPTICLRFELKITIKVNWNIASNEKALTPLDVRTNRDNLSIVHPAK